MKKPKWTRHIYSEGAVNTLTQKELSKIVSELSSVANKRLKYFESRGIQYYADYAPDTISGVRKFAAKGKTLGGLRAEYKRVSAFLQSPISTMSGRKERYYEMIQRMMSFDKETRDQYKDKTRRDIENEYLYMRDSTHYDSTRYDMFNATASLFEVMRKGKWLSKGIDTKNLDSTQWRMYFEEMAYQYRYADLETLITRVKEDLKIEELEEVPEGVGTSSAF